MSSGLQFYSFTTQPHQNVFSYLNSNAIGLFTTATPDVSGIVPYILENYSSFGITINSYFSINVNGFFKTSTGGTYTFIFYNTGNGLCNDDLSYFYIGSNAINPTLTNINKSVDFTFSAGNATYSIDLSGNTYYPIQIFYGQSGGGQDFSFGFVPPNGNITYDGTGYFYTVNGSGQTFSQYAYAINNPSNTTTTISQPDNTSLEIPVQLGLGTLSFMDRHNTSVIKEKNVSIGIGTTRNWRQKYRRSS